MTACVHVILFGKSENRGLGCYNGATGSVFLVVPMMSRCIGFRAGDSHPIHPDDALQLLSS